MICQKVKENVSIVYGEEIELVLTALQLLSGREEWQPDFYSEEERADWKRKYTVLFEVFAGMQKSVAVLDACQPEEFCEFSIEYFAKKLQAEATGRLVTELLTGYEPEVQKELIKSDEGLRQLFEVEGNQRVFTSFLSMRVFYRDADIWTREFASFANELRSEAFLAHMEKYRLEVEDEIEKLHQRLKAGEALDVSQAIMKKSFYHKGPFKQFVFVPSYMLGYKSIRFYGENQVLLYNPLKLEIQREHLLAQMKTIADETRMEMIKLLNKNGPMCGKDIAKEMKLAPSTVSHHIEQLRNAGLLHEEQVGKARYYSVRRESKADFVRLLDEIFG